MIIKSYTLIKIIFFTVDTYDRDDSHVTYISGQD